MNNFNRIEALRETVFSYLNYAQASISGHRVAAAVFAMRKTRSKSKKRSETESSDLFKVFGGCNLKISVSTVLEAITLYKALYIKFRSYNVVQSIIYKVRILESTGEQQRNQDMEIDYNDMLVLQLQ